MPTRRRFLHHAVRAAGAAALARAGTVGALFGQAPAIVRRDSARPAIPYGTASGDVTSGRAIVWSRADRAARMIVEYATTESFQGARRITGPVALEANGFTARVDLTGLPPAQRVFYRVLFEDPSDSRNPVEHESFERSWQIRQ